MKCQPALFIGHGSPMNAIEESPFTDALKDWGRELNQNPPKVILCVSAHWYIEQFKVTFYDETKLTYDFSGFPKKLHELKYLFKGSKEWAHRIQETYKTGVVLADEEWGIDHGVWSVLVHLFPKAEVPVVQLSMNKKYSFKEHWSFFAKLQKLREEGVLIIGSGNIVHSFAGLREEINAKPYDWALEFDERVKEAILTDNNSAIIGYNKFGKCAQLSVPTPEHYIPLLCTMSIKRKSDKIKFKYEGFQYSTISMRSFELSSNES